MTEEEKQKLIKDLYELVPPVWQEEFTKRLNKFIDSFGR